MSRLSILPMTVLALSLAACTQTEDRAPAPSSAPKAGEAPAAPPTSLPAPPSGSAEPKPGVDTPPPPATADGCGADKLADYLNQLPTAEVTARIGQTVGHDRIRTIKPGDMVTQDFRSDRLNVEIGEDGRIKRVRCG